MSEDEPLVSVIVPVFDGEAHVRDAVESVLAQTYDRLELVVVDDGSTDGTGEVLAAIEDRRMRVVHQENRGLSAARNRGVEESRGEILAFLDADDAWVPHKLETQMRLLGAEPAVVYSDVLLWDEEGGQTAGGYETVDRFPRERGKFQGWILRALLRQSFVHPSTLLVRRDDLETVGAFREDASPSADWDMALRLAGRRPFRRVDEPLVVVRRRAGSMTADRGAMRAASRLVLDDARRRLERDGRLGPGTRADLGLGYFASRNLDRARASLARALVRRPWRLDWWRWLAASVLWRPLRGGRETAR